MRVPSLSTARFAVLVALVLALFASGIVVGAVGAPMLLGQVNYGGGNTTSLTSSTSGAALAVNNPGSGRAADLTASTGVPLKITAPSGKAPMIVNRSTKVTNLNADQLDGLHAGAFLRASRIRSGKASGLSAGNTVLVDPRTGAEVLTANSGRLAIKNRDSTLTLQVAGVCVWSTYVQPISTTVAPGATAEFACYTVYDQYADLSLLLQAPTVAKSKYSHLTCSFADSATPSAVIRACIVTG